MRSRRVVSLSAVAIAALALVGCASGGGGGAQPSSTAGVTPQATQDALAADMCDQPFAEGEASKSITATGDQSAAPTVSIGSDAVPASFERTVLTEGTGEKIAEGDYVQWGVAMYDAAGTLLEQQGYDGTGAIVQATADSGAGQYLGCVPAGSRVAIAAPAADGSGTVNYLIYDIFAVTPSAQWCQPTETPGTLPTVAWTDNKPAVTIPAGEAAPSELELSVLKEGDGAEVQPGDTVSVNYLGVKWSDGTTFDSSYERGAPSDFPTTGVVTGFKNALEGQKVGSQVLVAFPPKCGYAGQQSELSSETLVFVVEIVDSKATK